MPRLYKLGYLEVALVQIEQGASFERIRQALIGFAAAQKGGGQLVVYRTRDPYTFWSPTQEAVSELMRLNLVMQAALPSERRYVDEYANATYELTSEGQEAARKLKAGTPSGRADFLDLLSVALFEAHPGFARLISEIEQDPLCIPEYTIEKISRLADQGSSTSRLAEDAIRRMTQHWPKGAPEPNGKDLVAGIAEALERRFPRTRMPKPSQKDVLDTIDDAILTFAARSRNIRLDAISFNVCMSWASQLAILEESRYVEDWPGRTVWATARIDGHQIHRTGFTESADDVADALVNAFRTVAQATPEAQASGYLPIFRVRAQAAFATRVNLRFVDKILERLLSGSLATPYTVRVALGRGTRPPPSEPIFTHKGRRFFEMSITEQENNHAT